MKVEKDYERKIIDLLEPFVGQGRVVARVSLDLNFAKKHTKEEIFEPEGTIRSQQTTENVSSSTGKTNQNGGVPGVQSNIEDPTAGNNDGSVSSNNEASKNIINYEISKKIIEHEDNNYSTINKITAAVTFDSGVLANVDNRDEFLNNIVEVVQDTIGFDDRRGDKITVKDFKFVTSKENGTTVDENGNPIEAESVDTISQIKSLMNEFSEYFQYLIALILLFVFYRKFIVKNEVIVLGDGTTAGGKKGPGGKNLTESGVEIPGLNDDTNLEEEYDVSSAKGRLKSKVKSQIMNNLEGLDEEAAAKYEVLIEEIDKIINEEPAEIAKMIELLLSEGNTKFRNKKGK